TSTPGEPGGSIYPFASGPAQQPLDAARASPPPMVARAAPTGPNASGPARCRCGHYPTSHMRVAPVGAGSPGNFRLEPTGPCAVCGDAGCARFTPAL
ncbi:MAG: hypothetical protein ACHQ16_04730, partial [Candidatus Lutacidiplasmatales archaeon]